MPQLLLITTGLTGMLHASLEVVARLEAAGYQVTYACPKDVRAQVEAQGFTYVQLPAVNFNPAPQLPDFKYRWQRWLYKFSKISQRQEEAVKQLGMDDFAARLQVLKPDLILLGIELHEHIITSVALKYPVILLSPWFSSWERPSLPTLQSELIPNADNLNDLQNDWRKARKKRQSKNRKQRYKSGFTDRQSILKYYARQVGFPKQELITDQWPGPLAYRNLPVLSLTAWNLEFPHEPRPNLHYVGPMVYTARKDTRTTSATYEQLDKIFKLKKKTGQKLIYCSATTMKESDGAFLKKVIKAVSSRPDWLLIAGSGGVAIEELPDNVYVFDWIPQLLVLEHADCSINHGGIHTINECVHFEVPMLIYSGQQHDQNGCAARVAYHGLGLSADKNEDEAIMIRQRIEQVLSDEAIQKNMQLANEAYLLGQEEKLLEKAVTVYL